MYDRGDFSKESGIHGFLLRFSQIVDTMNQMSLGTWVKEDIDSVEDQVSFRKW